MTNQNTKNVVWLVDQNTDITFDSISRVQVIARHLLDTNKYSIQILPTRTPTLPEKAINLLSRITSNQPELHTDDKLLPIDEWNASELNEICKIAPKLAFVDCRNFNHKNTLIISNTTLLDRLQYDSIVEIYVDKDPNKRKYSFEKSSLLLPILSTLESDRLFNQALSFAVHNQCKIELFLRSTPDVYFIENAMIPNYSTLYSQNGFKTPKETSSLVNRWLHKAHRLGVTVDLSYFDFSNDVSVAITKKVEAGNYQLVLFSKEIRGSYFGHSMAQRICLNSPSPVFFVDDSRNTINQQLNHTISNESYRYNQAI